MLEVQIRENGDLHLSGRFDASQVDTAYMAFKDIASSCVVDFEGLDYISSAGLGILMETQQRLEESGHALKLIRMNPHVRLVFEYAGFDLIFEIE